MYSDSNTAPLSLISKQPLLTNYKTVDLSSETFQPVWIAVNRTELSCQFTVSEELLWQQQLGQSSYIDLKERLKESGKSLSTHAFIPLHPNVYESSLAAGLAPLIKCKKVIVLGDTDDSYIKCMGSHTYKNTVNHVASQLIVTPNFYPINVEHFARINEQIKNDSVLSSSKICLLQTLGQGHYFSNHKELDLDGLIQFQLQQLPENMLSGHESILSLTSLFNNRLPENSNIADHLLNDEIQFLTHFIGAVLIPLSQLHHAYEIDLSHSFNEFLFILNNGEITGFFIQDHLIAKANPTNDFAYLENCIKYLLLPIIQAIPFSSKICTSDIVSLLELQLSNYMLHCLDNKHIDSINIKTLPTKDSIKNMLDKIFFESIYSNKALALS